VSDVTRNPILQASFDALAAGLCPIRVRADGSKRPQGEWKRYMSERPDQADLMAWFGRNPQGLGVVCGEISDRLIMIEFEARAMRLVGKFKAALIMTDFELFKEVDAWLDGYCERTPSGGVHILIHVGGDEPLPGNDKLAVDWQGNTMIETRGEGGFTIVAPSNGTTHPTGGSWKMIMGGFDTIAWTTRETFEVVLEILRGLSENPPGDLSVEQMLATPTLPAPPPTPNQKLASDPWFDDEKALLPPVDVILMHHGWKPTNSRDWYGQHWVRPGKDPREGHSASLSWDAQRLYVHSTNAGLPVGASLDNLDLILILDEGIAHPTLQDRTNYIVERRKAHRPAATPQRQGNVGDDGGSAGTDSSTSSLNLPDEFWQARSYLTQVSDAAWSRYVNPDALWEAVKAFYAATVHPRIVLPLRGTCDYIALMVGGSGAGKTVAQRTALDLFGPDFHEHPRMKLGVPAGTGEGMVEFFIDRADGQQRQRFDGAGFYVDEGKWLLDVNSRLGNTSVQAIKQAWSGQLTGSLAATAERSRWLQPGAVRVGLLISIQPGVAAEFLRSDLTEGGFPQRLSMGWCHPNAVPDVMPEHPGLLDVPMWTLEHWGTSYDPYAPRKLTYVPELMAHLEEVRRDGLLGGGLHDGHATLATLKGAALLALMDDRTTVTMDDWELAQLDWAHTVAVRTHLLTTQEQGVRDSNEAAGRAMAARTLAAQDVFTERALHSLVSKLRSTPEGLDNREIKDHLRAYSRRHSVHHQEVVTLGLSRGLIRRGDDARYHHG
jgi:hypothetical protein